MARFIIFDRETPPHPDPVEEAGRFLRGMVVSVLEDGAHPGTDVLKSGWFRIIDVPGKAIDYREFTAAAPATMNDKDIPRCRQRVLDVVALERTLGVAPLVAMSAVEIKDGAKVAAKQDVPIVVATEEHIHAAKSEPDYPQDPMILS